MYNTQTKRVAFNVTKMPSGSGAEGEVHCFGTSGTGEYTECYYVGGVLFCETKEANILHSSYLHIRYFCLYINFAFCK